MRKSFLCLLMIFLAVCLGVATACLAPATSNATATSVAMVHYSGFEDGTQHWNSSEEQFKFVRLISGPSAYNSANALKMETELSTSGVPVLNYSELQLVFKPGNVPNPGPHNLVGKGVSMEVYFPAELFEQGGRVCGYAFIRDQQFNPQNTAERCFGKVDAEVWHHFEMIVGIQSEGHIDENFDSDQVMSVGFRFNAVENLPYHKGWVISIDDVKVGFSTN